MNNNTETLKPVSLPDSNTKKTEDNAFAEAVLLKALPTTTDLGELKQIAKFKSENEVLRTLNKLAIRKEFHNALVNAGLTIEQLVGRLQQLLLSDSEKISIQAVGLMMKSLGLDKYEEGNAGGKSWEELLLDIHDREVADDKGVIEMGDYVVNPPELVAEGEEKRKKETDLEKELYG